jgi:hypothetical protein
LGSKVVLTVLQCCVEFLEKFRIWFDFVWRLNAKDIKELEKRKKKRRKQNKK